MLGESDATIISRGGNRDVNTRMESVQIKKGKECGVELGQTEPSRDGCVRATKVRSVRYFRKVQSEQ